MVSLYKLLKISLFIDPKRPRGKSSNCHINWLARAGRSILVTKFRADVLDPLSHSAAQNRVSNAGNRSNAPRQQTWQTLDQKWKIQVICLS